MLFRSKQPQVGGLEGLFSHPAVADSLSFLPDFSDWRTAAIVFVIPIAVQWWSAWYPGAEPGGGGYVAQRMLAARNERESMLATLWFNVAHYALRPWPWILVALASMIIYPDLAALRAQFPNLDPDIVRHDLAYSAMLLFLPHGLLGLVVASLAAAYMSTISTHLNWGASYIVDQTRPLSRSTLTVCGIASADGILYSVIFAYSALSLSCGVSILAKSACSSFCSEPSGPKCSTISGASLADSSGGKR
mgnify:CR=1 FL=1